MKKLNNISMMWFSIWFSMLFMFTYMFCILLEVPILISYLMFLASPLVVIWVVVAILKDKNEPKKTFDEFLYQDSELKWTK